MSVAADTFKPVPHGDDLHVLAHNSVQIQVFFEQGGQWPCIGLKPTARLWWSSYFGQFDKFFSCRLMLESNG